MESTSEHIEQIMTVLKTETKPVNPSVITQKLGWNKDKIDEVCRTFSAKSFTEVLIKINGVQIKKDEHGTAYVSYNENLNNNQKENSESVLKSVRERIEKLIEFLNTGLYEKDEAIRLALLSAVAGESIFFLGPPGTAKSMISSRIHHAFKERKKYERIFTGGSYCVS